MYHACLADKLLLTFLQGDGVHDAFAGRILQSLDYRIPVRGVYHYGSTGDGRLSGDVAQEDAHLLGWIHHRIVHVDVDDAGATLDLCFGNRQSFIILAAGDEPGELA